MGIAGVASAKLCHAALEEWQFEIVPLAWSAGMEGHESVQGMPAQLSTSISDLIHLVDVGAATRFTARRGSVTWFAEANYVRLEGDEAGPDSLVRTRSDETFGEGGLSYDITPAFSLYGGLRYRQIQTSVQTATTLSAADESWVDGLFGFRWLPVQSEHWLAWIRGDVGSGKSSSAWLVEAGGGYRSDDAWSVYLAYRVLDTNYWSDVLRYDTRQFGLQAGVGFRF
jgi:opacity protein-like surface antigen